MNVTYDEVVAYAKEAGLIGKIDTVRFYEYYAKQSFMYRGQPMDWKGKMHEWAKTQRGAVRQSATEYKAVEKMAPKVSLEELRRRVAMI